MNKRGLFAVLLISVLLCCCKKDDDLPELPPEVVKTEVVDIHSVRLFFNKDIEVASGSTLSHYELNAEVDKVDAYPIKAAVDGRVVTLSFKKEFRAPRDNQLLIKEVRSSTGARVFEKYFVAFYYIPDIKWKKVEELSVPVLSEDEAIDPENWVYFSLENKAQVAFADVQNSENWDVAFSFDDMTMPIFGNDPLCQPGGKGKIGLITRDVQEVKQLSDNDFDLEKCYNVTSEFDFPIVHLSRIGWCRTRPDENGDIPEMYIGPPFEVVPERTIVVKLGKGTKYAKIQMLGMYKGNPVAPTADQERYILTFRYVIQEDGSSNLDIPIDVD
ncbi:HmuY family protein [Flavobacterium sp. JP2137]|uniref:HmuY family protein n=1 Tax=Flavobacterium sp. JP2137 TaxID=3414510 RepID=UPI003D3000A3